MIAESTSLSIEDYNYFLPPERIAQYPLEKRDESKLLFYNSANNEIQHRQFYELPEIINSNYVLIRNNTKVFPARFFLKKQTGGNVELLIETPLDGKVPEKALNSPPPQKWQCIMRGRNLIPGLTLSGRFSNLINIKANIVDIHDSQRVVQLEWEPSHLSLSELLEEIGKIPLPEYIKREPKSDDKIKYQTVFSQKEGSIAAPTAGLHFTDEVNEKLLKSGVDILDITLHVGSGTFVPLKTSIVDEHKMHSEQFQIDIQLLKKMRDTIISKRKIIATGTTTVRTLESLYWLGLSDKIDFDSIKINQWIWRQTMPNTTALSSIDRLIELMDKENRTLLIGETQLMIVPGYEFKIVNGMITNFHLPKSTLLLLVAAFTGREKMLEIYQNALDNSYRFLSYGDATLLLK